MMPIGAVLAAACVVVLAQQAHAETLRETMEGAMNVEITYPDSVIAGREFPVSFLVRNDGWEDKGNVTLHLEPGAAITITGRNEIKIERLAAGGSYGETAGFAIMSDAPAGPHFINVRYSQVLLENNEVAREPDRANMAITLNVRERPSVSIQSITPEAIFTQAEFPFVVLIRSDDIDLSDLQVRLVPPEDISFRGETLHVFSHLEKGDPLTITSRIVTPQEEVVTEYGVPFQILVTYVDDMGETHNQSQTVSLTLRPRTFMEIETDGGIWIGGFFIAPYVSIGTIVGIPAGLILSLIVRRRTHRPPAESGEKT